MVDLTGEPRAAELAPWAVPWLTLTSFRGVTLPPCTVDMDSEWEQIHSYMTSLLKWLYHSTPLGCVRTLARPIRVRL